MVIDILKDIVKINTANPGGNTKDLINYIIKKINKYDFEYEIFKTSESKVNLIIKVRGKVNKTVVLNGHLDTKPYGNMNEWKYDPYAATEENKRIYGLGACDMKAGVASMITLLCTIGEEKLIPRWNLEFHFVDDEENNSTYGMKSLLNSNILQRDLYDLAVVCEPTENSLLLESLGNSWKIIKVKGKKAHAGHYEEGVNANEVLANVLIKAQKKISKMKGENPSFPMFPNINIGIFKGGDHPGSVTDYSEAVIDIRVSKEFEKKMILEEIENVLEEYDVHYQINDYLPEMYSWDYKNLSTEFSSECLNILMDKFKDTFKQVIAKNKFYGGSDAGYYAEKLGVPTIIFGPGSLQQAHQPNEWVNIKGVMDHFKILQKWMIDID